jgi:ATP-dependent RNA helicase DeaD
LPLIENYERDNNVSAMDIAAALASIAQGATPLLLEPQARSSREAWSPDASESGDRAPRRERAPRPDRAARNEKYAKRERELESRAREQAQEPSPSSEWAGEGEAAPRERSPRFERRERPDHESAWPKSTGRFERAAEFERSLPEDEPQGEQGPKPLNRRERRALERAEREKLAGAGEGAAGQHESAGSQAGPEASAFNVHGEELAVPAPARRPTRAEEGSRESRPSSEVARPRKRTDDRFERGQSRDFGDERRPRRGDDEAAETYRIEVGHDHGVKPGNIVGAIANEAGLDGRHIGRVVIRDDHSFVDLPTGMPKDVFLQLQKVRVAGQPLQISRALKSHAAKLRGERSAAPKFRKQNDSTRAKSKTRTARDSKRRR